MMGFDINKIKKIIRGLILLFILILIGSVFFLYRYFYQTLTQAQVVVLLKSQVSSDVLNIALWKKVMDNLEYKKTTLVDKNNLPPNPFSHLEPTSALPGEN